MKLYVTVLTITAT